MSTMIDIDSLDWNKSGGLLPAVVQDADNMRVLMLGYMDRQALQVTCGTGQVTFFSRSRNRLWTKGETSGNTLGLVAIETDCDADSLLVRARPQGPTCHLGRDSCFADAPGDVVAALDALVASRVDAPADASYTARLFAGGVRRIAQKVGEEGVETALAAVTRDDGELLGECADLLYHLLVLLKARNLSFDQVVQELGSRHAARP